jgi:hypothetical protein
MFEYTQLSLLMTKVSLEYTAVMPAFTQVILAFTRFTLAHAKFTFRYTLPTSEVGISGKMRKEETNTSKTNSAKQRCFALFFPGYNINQLTN